MSSTGSHFECFIPQLVVLFGKDSENLRKWGLIEVCHSRSARGGGFSLDPPISLPSTTLCHRLPLPWCSTQTHGSKWPLTGTMSQNKYFFPFAWRKLSIAEWRKQIAHPHWNMPGAYLTSSARQLSCMLHYGVVASGRELCCCFDSALRAMHR